MNSMRQLLLFVAAFTLACSEVPRAPHPPRAGARALDEWRASAQAEHTGHFTLVFTREYGMWKFRACRLEIGVFVKRTRAVLECEPLEGPPVHVTRDLADEQRIHLRELVESADLYGANHIGRDSTPGDGVFETIRIRPAGGGRAAVLVTSGNDSFVDDEARRGLLEFLKRIELDLSAQAGLVRR
jgi:hypothetical protein